MPILILILILITGKQILLQFPSNWLTMKVTYFVIDFDRSCCTTVQYTVTVVATSNKNLFIPITGTHWATSRFDLTFARTQMSYRPITPYSVDSLLFLP